MNKTGFGFLRLPQKADGSIDYEILNPMVDRFLELGGTYFDTAYTYLEGRSEEAVKKALVQRHCRERYILADKLPGYLVKSHSECYDYFDRQLQRCNVEYFDVFLLHWLTEENYALAQRYDEFGFLQERKAAGKVRKTGFSFHDSPELLDRILREHPEVDIVQLQINYLDWGSPTLQAEQLYQVAKAYGKEIVIMEPVKGGKLACVPEQAEALLRQLRPADSPALWAIRFASSLPEAAVVLSGMNAMGQLEENMRPISPLTEQEGRVLEECARIIRRETAVGCTGCGYCLNHCPRKIPIPQVFTLYNDYARSPLEGWKMGHAYQSATQGRGRASDCIGCRQCEAHCPQKLPVTEFLEKVKEAFEK